MIRLLMCDSCEYVGDLSDLPADKQLDIELRNMSESQARQEIVKRIVETRSWFHKIGWTSPKDDYDLCPDCSAK